MLVISVNVGLPRGAVWQGIQVETAIFKDPVDGAVKIGELNLAGDKQADLTVHGGPEKAVYAYPADHYEYWRKELPKVAFSPGKFGENLTTEGLGEDTLCIRGPFADRDGGPDSYPAPLALLQIGSPIRTRRHD